MQTGKETEKVLYMLNNLLLVFVSKIDKSDNFKTLNKNKMINLNAIAEKALIETVRNGGCSIDIETGEAPEKGFFVSYSPYEKTVPIYKGTMLRETIKAFIIDNEHLLKQNNNVRASENSLTEVQVLLYFVIN